MYDLSVIVSGIRPQNWLKLAQDIKLSCGDLDIEIIFTGPYYTEELNNYKFTFVRDFGSPSRAFSKTASLANGKYICQCPDDGIIYKDALKKCYDSIKDKPKTACIVRYNEGENHSGKEFPLEYWNARYHWVHFQACQAIKPEWNAGPWFMLSYEYFCEMGGLDCRFEHLNLNVYDLIYRIYRDGGSTVFSPEVVASLDWVPGQTPYNSPCCAAFIYNDMPMLGKLYANDEIMAQQPIKIKPNSWKESPELWARRFK